MSDSSTSDLFSYLKEQSSRSSSSELHSTTAPASSDEDVSESPETEDAASDDAAEAESDLSFEDPMVGEQLRNASEEALNNAHFGIIQLDDDGTVQFYNTYESNLSGVDPEEALGQNFFNELAPCSNNRVFYGRFRDGLKQGEMDEYFTYTFTYKMRPTLVDVHLYRDDAGSNWIMVRKR